MTQTALPAMPRRDEACDLHVAPDADHLVNRLIDRIAGLHRRLAAARSLDPGPVIDAVFDELVRLAVAAVADDIAEAVVTAPSIRRLLPDLHRLSRAGETALEMHWARRLITHAELGLEAFPYHDNYRRLTRLEHRAVLGASGRTPTRVAFVGSGPLPLTSILLSGAWGADVVNLDLDPTAHDLARTLVSRLGLPTMGFRTADVVDHHDLGGFDVVWLAALVGVGPDRKARILTHLFDHVDPGTVVVVRSAHGMRRLLYPEVAVHDLGGFRPLAVIHPHTDVVNSVVVAQKPEQR